MTSFFFYSFLKMADNYLLAHDHLFCPVVYLSIFPHYFFFLQPSDFKTSFLFFLELWHMNVFPLEKVASIVISGRLVKV